MSNRAWVTLATNDSYGLGALVLAHSLRRAGSAYPAVVLITPSVTEAMRDRLSAVFAEVVMVDVLDSGDAAHLALLQRPELGITFTKIHCWNLTQYEKCVFLDADTLVVQNCDELFEREELSAAPDVGWPDCFNSGVFVYKPSAETFAALIEFAQQRGSFDGGDQGLLNSYFSDWAHGDINKHLPFLYNVTSAAFYSYLPALKHYGRDLKIIHFIGAAKPWLLQFDWRSRQVQAPEHLRELLQLWWDLFVAQVHSQLEPSMVEVEDAPTTLELPQEAYVYTEPTLPVEYNNYKPVLDPDSEFHWHRPEAQISQSKITPSEIDLAQFHDPWDMYQGHIAPMTEEAKSISYSQIEEQQEIRQHVWELPHHNIQPQNTHYEINHVNEHNRESRNEQNTQYTQPDAGQFYHHNTYNPSQGSHGFSQEHIEHCEYNKETQSPSNFNYDQQSNYSHYRQSYHSIDYKNSERDYQDHDNTSQYSNEFHTQHSHHESQYQPYYEPPPPLDFHSYQQEHPSSDNHENVNYNQEHFNHHSNEINPPHVNTNGTFDSHSQLEHDNTFSYAEKDVTHFTHTLRNRVEYVYCLHLDHDRGRYRRKRNLDTLQPISEITNDDTELELNGHDEFIIPRHPYDGFYLRHRMTIDARGRKICTHEIPPTPSPSLSPPESPIFFDAVSEVVSQDDANLDHEDNSGVAGNLARVIPDAVGASEAIDELTRRQGWEAGNIDYMGADSFDNIWAKISQTLSQPPASPPKQPTPPPQEPTPVKEPEQPAAAKEPEQPAPAKEPEQPAPAKASEESAPAEKSEEPTPVEQSEELASATKPEEPAATQPVEEPQVAAVEAKQPEVAPNATEASSETAVQADPAPVEAPAKSEVSAPSECALKVADPAVEDASKESALPAEPSPVQTAVEAPISKETVPNAEATPQPASSEEASVPVETADIPIEASTPVDIPVPVVEAVSAQAAKPTDASPIAPEEIPAPVLEASITVESPKTDAAPQPPEEPKPADAEVAKEEPPKQETPAKVVAPLVVAAEIPSIAAAEPAKPEEKPAKPEEVPVATATDSPPLANTPSTEVPADPAAKSEERRRPAGKLQLSPPLAADPLPTPDSELEDAASLAQSIIASELRTPTVTSASPVSPAPPAPRQEQRLSAQAPQIPTPPVSLTQIGVKPAKGKATIAAQIESSVTDKPAPEPKADAPKKKVVKKVLKKESSGEAPVPPPRKKEKKPKEK